ncbi:MAG: hypothetical protein FWH01_14775 [Oscillospiraceae bacterium]|nr:hypothetical protein [Oscillospiraceae bacterium]
MNFKRILTFLVALAMLAGVFAGCAPGGQPAATTAAATTAAATTAAATTAAATTAAPTEAAITDGGTEYMTGPGILPIVREGYDITLTMLRGTNANIPDPSYGENVFTTYLVDRTGVMLDFVTAPEADGGVITKFNLLMNSGDYPDLIKLAWQGPPRDIMAYWSANGAFVPLDEHIEKYGERTKYYLEQYPQMRMYISGGDGKIYGMPNLNECLHCDVQNRFFIYQPFRVALGMDMPTTLDEYLTYLRRVRDENPNGSGKNDEIPLCMRSSNLQALKYAVMGSYMPVAVLDYSLTPIDGVIQMQYLNPMMKDVLEYINVLYEEELFNRDAFTITDDDFRAYGDFPDYNIIASQCSNQKNNPYMRGSNEESWMRYAETEAVPQLRGPEGVAYMPRRGDLDIIPGMFVTDKCEYPDVAVRLIDEFYDDDVSRWCTSGPYGEWWEYADEGSLGLDGRPAKYKGVMQDYDKPINTCWYENYIVMRPSSYRLAQQADGREVVMKSIETRDRADIAEARNYQSLNELHNYHDANLQLEDGMPDEFLLPPLVFPEEVALRIGEIKAVLGSYIDQTHVAFISGERSFDTWDAYVKEMNDMGAAELVDIYNERLRTQFPDRAKQ